MRIISLLPAATDWLMAFGAEQDLVAQSHLCRGPSEIPVVTRAAWPLPEDVLSIERVREPGLAKEQVLTHVDEVQLMELHTDLVIVEDESQVTSASGESLADLLSRMSPQSEVFSFSPRTMKQILDRALALGNRIGRLSAAMACIAKGEERIRHLRARIGAQRDGTIRDGDAPRAVCLQGVDPMVAAGRWVPDLIRLAGGDPVISSAGNEPVILTPDELRKHGADVIFVAAEESVGIAMAEFRSLAMPTTQAWIVNGTRFTRTPGPALYRTIELFAAAFHGAAGVAFDGDELRPLAEALQA